MSDAKSVLKSLSLAGVEWELVESHGARADTATAPARPAMAGFVAPKATAPVASGDIMETAIRLADLPDIALGIGKFETHPLFSTAKNTVVPKMPVTDSVSILVVTDIPSLADDGNGNILSGADGELFDKMLKAINLTRDQIAITPLVFWRPPGGRAPTTDELAFCKPFVDKIIKTLKPKKILTLGALAAKTISGATLPKDHGKEISAHDTTCIAIYKPDFILQNPNVKPAIWNALKLISG